LGCVADPFKKTGRQTPLSTPLLLYCERPFLNKHLCVCVASSLCRRLVVWQKTTTSPLAPPLTLPSALQAPPICLLLYLRTPHCPQTICVARFVPQPLPYPFTRPLFTQNPCAPSAYLILPSSRASAAHAPPPGFNHRQGGARLPDCRPALTSQQRKTTCPAPFEAFPPPSRLFLLPPSHIGLRIRRLPQTAAQRDCVHTVGGPLSSPLRFPPTFAASPLRIHSPASFILFLFRGLPHTPDRTRRPPGVPFVSALPAARRRPPLFFFFGIATPGHSFVRAGPFAWRRAQKKRTRSPLAHAVSSLQAGARTSALCPPPPHTHTTSPFLRQPSSMFLHTNSTFLSPHPKLAPLHPAHHHTHSAAPPHHTPPPPNPSLPSFGPRAQNPIEPRPEAAGGGGVLTVNCPGAARPARGCLLSTHRLATRHSPRHLFYVQAGGACGASP
jgi:hypothetical protein